MPKSRPRVKSRDKARRNNKKKVSILTHKRVDYIDYKDVELLRRFVSDRGKIRGRSVTGNDEQQQRTVAGAIKNAREMALLPYVNLVTTQRGAGRSGERSGERRTDGPPGRRSDGPPPAPPGAPPPSAEETSPEAIAEPAADAMEGTES
jgi:small subunit ribosomal protein S18